MQVSVVDPDAPQVPASYFNLLLVIAANASLTASTSTATSGDVGDKAFLLSWTLIWVIVAAASFVVAAGVVVLILLCYCKRRVAAAKKADLPISRPSLQHRNPVRVVGDTNLDHVRYAVQNNGRTLLRQPSPRAKLSPSMRVVSTGAVPRRVKSPLTDAAGKNASPLPVGIAS